jgi:hypothetical protein
MITRLAAKKAKAYKLYKINSSDLNVAKNFKLLSSKIKNEVRRAKIRYYTQLLDNDNKRVLADH